MHVPQHQRGAQLGEAAGSEAMDHCRPSREVHCCWGEDLRHTYGWVQTNATRGFAVKLLYVCCVLQLEVLKQYLDSGGALLVMLGEGGEMKYDTNINFLLEEFGIMINNGKCVLVLMSPVHQSHQLKQNVYVNSENGYCSL